MRGNALLLAATALALVLVGIAAAWTSVHAQGIGVAPAEIRLSDALRGSEYVRTLTVINNRDSILTFKVTSEGEAGQWSSLHPPDDPAATLDKIVAPAQTKTQVTLRLAVPADAANGPHKGSIRLQSTVGEEGEGSGSGVSIGVAVQLTLDVTGTQKLTGSVLDVATSDVEVGYPLRIKTRFQNTGNVKAQPRMRLQVKDAKAVVVGEASYADTTVDVGAIETIQSEWDTTGKEPGDYVASVAISLADAQLGARELPFKILPVGTLTRQGVLDELTLENAPYAGAVAELAAHFRNTGEIDTRAVFLGEVHYKDALIDTVSTPERLVQKGETVALEAFVKVLKPGTYTVTGKVNYEGKETEAKEVTFDVLRAPGAGGDELPLWAWIAIGGGGLAAVVVLIVGSWVLARRVRRFFRL